MEEQHVTRRVVPTQDVVGVAVRFDVGHPGQALVPDAAPVRPALVGFRAEHGFAGRRALEHGARVLVGIGIAPRQRAVGHVPAVGPAHDFEAGVARDRVRRDPRADDVVTADVVVARVLVPRRGRDVTRRLVEQLVHVEAHGTAQGAADDLGDRGFLDHCAQCLRARGGELVDAQLPIEHFRKGVGRRDRLVEPDTGAVDPPGVENASDQHGAVAVERVGLLGCDGSRGPGAHGCTVPDSRVHSRAVPSAGADREPLRWDR